MIVDSVNGKERKLTALDAVFVIPPTTPGGVVFSYILWEWSRGGGPRVEILLDLDLKNGHCPPVVLVVTDFFEVDRVLDVADMVGIGFVHLPNRAAYALQVGPTVRSVRFGPYGESSYWPEWGIVSCSLDDYFVWLGRELEAIVQQGNYEEIIARLKEGMDANTGEQ